MPLSLLSLLLGSCHGKAGSTHAHVSWGNFGNFGRLQSRPSVQRPTVHRSPSVSQTYSVSTPTTPTPPQSYTSPVPPALKSTYTPPHAVTPASSDGDATNLHSNHHAHVSFGGKTSHSFGNTVKKRPSAHQTPSVSVTTYSAPPIPTTPTPPQSYTSSVPPTVFQSTYASPLPVIDTPGKGDAGHHSGPSNTHVSVHGRRGNKRPIQHHQTPSVRPVYDVSPSPPPPTRPSQSYTASPSRIFVAPVTSASVAPAPVVSSYTPAPPPTFVAPVTSAPVDDCTVSYELSCISSGKTQTSGNTLLDCPPGEKEICVDVMETECRTTTKKECREYEQTSCEIESKEICIIADKTECKDTYFTPQNMTCSDNPSKQTCHSFETQLCHDPIPEQVCDQRTKVICKPETFTICKTVVSTVEKEECLELREPDCKEYRKKMCYNGYSSGECHIHTEDECHYITKPCTYKDGYGCKPTKEKICNQISKPKCTGAGASIQCTNLYNQHCKVKPVIKCIQVPVVTVSDHCETKTVNNCNEVSSSECLTIYKTQCEEPERHEICLDPSGQHCQVHNLAPVINRVCEGQQKEICFDVPNTICQKHRKEHCVDIPVMDCEKNYTKKCFNVPVPPQLVQVPKLHCHGGGAKQGGGHEQRRGARVDKNNRGYPYKQ